MNGQVYDKELTHNEADITQPVKMMGEVQALVMISPWKALLQLVGTCVLTRVCTDSERRVMAAHRHTKIY